MPHIIPISDLKNTGELSKICKETQEPIFVTKNGYGDMVIMSIETYERNMFLIDAYEKLAAAEREVNNGNVLDADQGLKNVREKYNV